MMRSLHDSAYGQRGASLPLALLLFLICVMAASVVLSAGSVAAGRVADLAESDQLYYNVTSAVRVFRSELAGADGEGGHSVTVRLVKSDSGSQAPTFAMSFDDRPVGSTAKFNVVERAAFFALFGEKAEDASEAQMRVSSWYTEERWEDWLDDFGDSYPDDVFETIVLKHESSDLSDKQADALADLNVDARIDEGGNLVFAFRSADDATASPLLTLVCEGDYGAEALDVTDGAANAVAKVVTVTWRPSEVSTQSESGES